MPTTFERIRKAFDQIELTPVMVGGWAMNFLGHSRQTLDIDLMILADDFEKVRRALESVGYKMVFRNPELFAKFQGGADDLLELDILFADVETLEKMKNDAQEIESNGFRFLLPSARHMIAMKLHALKNNFKLRLGKDFPDVVALIDIAGLDVASANFKHFCLEFGDEKIYHLLLNLEEAE